MPTIIHKPTNKLQRIDEVYLFISSDETGEGVCAAPIDGTLMPMVAADKARLDSLIPIARDIAKATGMKIKLIKLPAREEIMDFGLDGGMTQ